MALETGAISEQRFALVPYDSGWPILFEHERERLQAVLGALARRIEHNGSTSVPGLAAKPVIDIQISVSQLGPIDRYRTPLQSLGYCHVAHEDDAFCPFFHRPKHWPHTYHIHVVEAGGEEETRTLAFRDYLSRVLKDVFNTLLSGPRMAQRNHAQFYVLDFGSAAKTTLFASDVGKSHGWTFSTAC